MNINKEYDELLEKADTITAEQIDEVSKLIEEESIVGKDLEEAKELAENANLENEEALAKVVLNPVTGKPMLTEEWVDDEHAKTLDDLFDEPIAEDDIDPKTITIGNEAILQATADMFPQVKLSDVDIDIIIKAADRYKTEEKFAFYNAMPQVIKNGINDLIGIDMATKMGGYNKEGRNYAASMYLDSIISNQLMSTALTDFQQSVKKSIDEAYADIQTDDYWRQARLYFIEDIPKMATDLEEKGETEKAETCRKVAQAFTESFTYKDMEECYELGKLKAKKIQIEKFERTCKEFNFSYQKSKNIIQDISLAVTSVDNNKEIGVDCSIDIIREFFCIFINYTRFKHMDPNNIVDHTFMYYFIQNLITVDCYNPNNEDDKTWRDNFIIVINNFLSLIKSKHEEEK
jgi:hypothetical protein